MYLAVVDGFPSAPDPDRELTEPVGQPARESDAHQELNELRARAYGPEPDIETDPAALARLMDLEAVHVAVPAAVADLPPGPVTSTNSAWAAPTADAGIAVEQATLTAEPISERLPGFPRERFARSLLHRAAGTTRRMRLIVVSIGVILIVLAIGIGAWLTWLSGPRPDATLHRAYGETNSELLEVLEYQGWNPDASTVREFEPFHDVSVWSLENGVGYVCLVGWDRTSGRFATQCVPPGIELALYVVTTAGAPATDDFGERLPGGSFVSLHLRQDTVDVYVHDPRAAD